MSERRQSLINLRIAERIRQRRKSLGMSQTTLGRRIGVSYQQIGKYESGANRITASALLDIAGTLGLEIGRIYEGLSEELASHIGFADGQQEGYLGPIDTGTAGRLKEAFNRITDPRARESLAYLAERLAEAASAEQAPSPDPDIEKTR